jgi:hypothetical protein
VIKVTYAGRTISFFLSRFESGCPHSNHRYALRLAVSGLWDNERFEQASRKIPYSTLICRPDCSCTLGLTWPLFKLRQGRNERLAPAMDGLCLGVSLASASVTLMLLNASYAVHAQDEVDWRMARLANQIKFNVRLELNAASDQLVLGSGVPDRVLLQPSFPHQRQPPT